jgi:putative tryptophan/tyrosine transport system substrate-binding protein
MRRRDFIKLVAVCAAAEPLRAHAQQATKVVRIGVLAPSRPDNSDPSYRALNAFVPALEELGYTDGKNIAFERKFADGDVSRLRVLANELVEQRVDIIVALSTPAARAAKQATTTIPIVAINMADPVGDELVASLARPGGNVTGTAFLGPELVSRRLQLLKELVPGLSRVAVLWHPLAYSERTMTGMLKEIEGAANTLGTKLQFVPATGGGDLEPAFAAMIKERAQAIMIFPSPMLYGQYGRIVDLAASNRLPAIYAAREGADLGGLVSYGVNQSDLSRATAVYLEKILKGAKPADLPVQQPTKFELVVNLKTAKTLGLVVTREFLLVADEVIE